MISNEHKLFQQPWPEGEHRFFQMGFVVDDILAAAARWRTSTVWGHSMYSRGWSCLARFAFSLRHHPPDCGCPSRSGTDRADHTHCDRPSIYRDFQGGTGPAFHQLCTVTSDYDGKKAYYGRLGYELASEIAGKGDRICFFDTVEDFGFFTEVVEERPGFLAQLANIAQISAEWDGADPVRMLTRDGYRTPDDSDRTTARRPA